MACILCIEDSSEIRMIVRQALGSRHEFVQAVSLKEAREALGQQAFDLILLDINLPDGDGFRLCSEIKSNDQFKLIPIFILSGHDSIAEKTVGFQLGIDDYISKPFNPIELRLRVEAKLRKVSELKAESSHIDLVNLHIDFASQRVTLRNGVNLRAILFSSTEFKLFTFLARHPDQVKSREQLIAAVWGVNFSLSDRTIDSHISRIREKILGSDCFIEAVPNAGYRFEVRSRDSKACA